MSLKIKLLLTITTLIMVLVGTLALTYYSFERLNNEFGQFVAKAESEVRDTESTMEKFAEADGDLTDSVKSIHLFTRGMPEEAGRTTPLSDQLNQEETVDREINDGHAEIRFLSEAFREDLVGSRNLLALILMSLCLMVVVGSAIFARSMTKPIDGIIEKMVGTTKEVDQSAGKLLKIATQFSLSADDASGRSRTVSSSIKSMSANLQAAAAVMEDSVSNTRMVFSAAAEMSATNNEIAADSRKARAASDQAARKSKEASESVSLLKQTARKIGQVTETITDISEQTHLLALNATTEADRVGDTGKGFAVAANEIKALAQQASAATGDIKAQIDAVQLTTSKTVETIGEITRMISDANAIVGSIATAVEAQSVATKEISNNIKQVSKGMGEVNDNVAVTSEAAANVTDEIDQVHAAVKQMSMGSNRVKQYADQLKQLAGGQNDIVCRLKDPS